MSFILEYPRKQNVAFTIAGEQEVEFQPSGRCVLDINSNFYFNMRGFGLLQNGLQGNFSKWVELNNNEGLAVTGLTSCGAVFVASSDFSRVAAGHMSGDAQYVKEWCDGLLKDSAVQPHFLVFGSGLDGSARTGGEVLMKYMKRFDIPPNRAPAVKGCGSVYVRRSGSSATVYASRSSKMW